MAMPLSPVPQSEAAELFSVLKFLLPAFEDFMLTSSLHLGQWFSELWDSNQVEDLAV